MLTAQRSTLRFFARLKAAMASVQQFVQTWIRQEIVDDDPCDVDTLFSDHQPDQKLQHPL